MSRLWINGSLIEKNEARVSPFDHGFLYGEGVWESLRVFKGQLFHPEDHVSNLFCSAERLGIEVPLTPAELIVAIETTLNANDRVDGYIRVIITRGAGTIGPDPRKITPQVIIIAEEYCPFPVELYDCGLHAVVCPTAIDSQTPLFQSRILGQPYIPLAKQYALQNGCLEAILTNQSGELIGTTEGFLFLVKDGAVVAAARQRPDATGYRIAGMAGDGGLVVAEYAIRLPDLFLAEEVFQAGAACGVIGIVQVDGKPIGAGSEGPVTRTIREAYKQRLTRG
jgi:branched-chain amino acid aminotransferase